MREVHGSTVEKLGSGLVSSVETFKGCRLEFVKRLSGFNGLSTNKDGEVRKIEIKTMETSIEESVQRILVFRKRLLALFRFATREYRSYGKSLAIS